MLNANNINFAIDELYKKIDALDYSNTAAIMRLSSEAEKLFSVYQNNTELLILQTHLQIMNSQEQRARALANRVWELGGNIRLMFEKMYLDDLINLGLTEMAAILLKPRFENPAEGGRIFPLEMVRFSLMTGNLTLLKRVANTRPNNTLFKALLQFADTYQRNLYERHFPQIQKIVLDNVGDKLCGYDFNFYTDRGFTDIEIMLYFSNYDFNIKKYQMLINNKIDGYCLTSGVKRINNLSFVCRNIKDRRRI
ncbi:MAG: hypothetical protein IJ529_01625 [Alphaproteobacteria bacterium]|nr:hypothetical protein [Alphaproteobacteria bacterium]